MTVRVPKKYPEDARFEVVCYSHTPERSTNKPIESLGKAVDLAKAHDKKHHKGRGRLQVQILLREVDPLALQLREQLRGDEEIEQSRRHGNDFEWAENRFLKE